MPTVTNLFPDPKFQTRDGVTTVLAVNNFPNPSPVSSLTGYTPVGTATLTQDSAVSIKGDGGLTVTSPDGASGVKFEMPAARDVIYTNSLTVYVRAHAAMTLTGTATAGYTLWGPPEIGWGDYGWGETFSYVKGASHTFAAGEVKRLRIGIKMKTSGTGANWTWGTPAGYVLQLLGTGTFDVDAVWLGDFNESGTAAVSAIPAAPLYFDGNTPDTGNYLYEWTGTPNASTSRQIGHLAKYLRTGTFGNDMAGVENAYSLTLPGGETAGALQSPWDLNQYQRAIIGPAGGVHNLREFGLTTGNSYVLSYDFVSLYENYIENNVSGGYDNLYSDIEFTGFVDKYWAIPQVHPQRQRIHIPFTLTADGAIPQATIDVYRNYVTGVTAFTSVSLFEVDVHATVDLDGTGSNVDLLALGCTPGGTYTAHWIFETLGSGKFYRIEYQTGGGGAWTSLAYHGYDAGYVSENYESTFTLPAETTAARMASSTGLYPTFDIFTTPPDYFDGDTPDGGGYAYAWSGTPGDSASLRTASSGFEGRYYIGGVGIPITEIRVQTGGVLTPAIEIGT
jgi:hypothetical protein